MGKITGGLAAVAIWFGAAAAAEAQVTVDATGPSHVFHTDTQCTVTGTVTGVSGTYYYNVSISVAGVVKHCRDYQTSGPIISRLIKGMGTWGMLPGQSFETKVTVAGVFDTYTTTVENGTTYLHPSQLRPAVIPAALKEEEFCLAGSGEEEAA